MAKKGKRKSDKKSERAIEKMHADDDKRKLAKDLRLSLKLRSELDRTFVVLERAIEDQTARQGKGKATDAGSADLALALRAHKVAVRALAYGDGGGGL